MPTYIGKTVTDLTGLIADAADVVQAEGEQEVVDGMNLSALTEGVHSWKTLWDFKGNVGTSASPLRVDCDQGASPQITLGQEKGKFFYYPGGDNSLCSKLVANEGVELYLCTGGTVTDLELARRVYAYIPDVVAVTNLRMNGGSAEQRYSATPNTIWHIDGGILHTGRGLNGTGVIMGGAEVTVAREDTSATLPTQATGILYVADGILRWKGGNIAECVLGKRGRIDLSEAPNDITVVIKGAAESLAKSVLGSKYATVTATVSEYCGSRTAIRPGFSGYLGP